MDTLEQDICAGIDRFIKLQIPFAIYRIPGENVVRVERSWRLLRLAI